VNGERGGAGASAPRSSGPGTVGHLTRRAVLQKLSLALGGAISAPILGGALGCRRRAPEVAAAEPWVPRTLTAEQGEWVASLAETILPATDTPGARGALVHEFIDLLLTDWMSEEETGRFLDGLTELAGSCREQYNAPFTELDTAHQLEFLRPRDEAGTAARNAEEEPLPFFATLKEMTLVGYYTSEIGMTQELRTQFFFPSYEGCVPLGSDGRSWA
jgi:glucoside 3-dehydrogenase (cytochrome c) hitch-hiker subunit